MHEYSLVQAMFDQMADVMAINHARAVRRRARVESARAPASIPIFSGPRTTCIRVRTFCADAPLDIADWRRATSSILEQLELEVR